MKFSNHIQPTMNSTRTGKIARLPQPVREELNQRLANGEVGQHLLKWLNTLPEVRQMLAAWFDGRPLNAQNLTEWRQGGYRDWLTERKARELARELGQKATSGEVEDEEGGKPLTEVIAQWVVAQYAVATQHVKEATEGDEHWRLLHGMCADIVALRRGDLRVRNMEVLREQRDLRSTEMAARDLLTRMIQQSAASHPEASGTDDGHGKSSQFKPIQSKKFRRRTRRRPPVSTPPPGP